MARPTRIVTFKDFTGGLNLSSQRQDLALNETPDCLDVDFDKRGGFIQRNGIRNVTTDSNMNGGYLLGSYSFGTDLLYGISATGRLWTWDGSAATHVATALTDSSSLVKSAAWTSRVYFANAFNAGSLQMKYYTGAAWGTLTNTANNNYSAPAGGNAPLARLIADHAGFMWWGDTTEAATRYRSRIRFSHYLQPEDFADADYFDIDPDDQTDQITALVPFNNMLVVFKKKSVWGVYGTSRTDFVVERLSAAAGVWTQESVAVAPDRIYWWSPDGDLYTYDGRGVMSIGARLRSLVDDGILTAGAEHRLCWAEGKLYMSLVLATGQRATYVFNPNVGAQGCWTKYSFKYTSMVWWRRNSGVNGVMATIASANGVYDLNITGQEQDYDGSSSTSIAAYYCTAWFAADDPALKKRFLRMYVTAACKDAADLNIGVYYNYDENTVQRTLTTPLAASVGGMVWGDVWGGNWGGADAVYTFDRLTSSGRAHAIRYKFYVTNHVSKWWVDSFALPYREKGYR